MHILAIHAHPDDIEMLGSGTLALLSGHGHRITIATMTAGDLGSTEHSPEETAQIRMREATAAAALIGASYRCAALPDLGVFNEDSARRRTVELIRSVSEERTLVMVEHDMSVVFGLADRISVLVYGEIIASDTPQRIRDNEAVRAAYLGGLDA